MSGSNMSEWSWWSCLIADVSPVCSGLQCSSSPSSSLAPTSLILQQETVRSRPSRRWWAAWTATPADTAPRCASRRLGRTCPRWPQRCLNRLSSSYILDWSSACCLDWWFCLCRSNSSARRWSRTSPTWCVSCSSSSTSRPALSPHASSTIEAEFLKGRWSRWVYGELSWSKLYMYICIYDVTAVLHVCTWMYLHGHI